MGSGLIRCRLGRPRARLKSPVVDFRTSATLRSSEDRKTGGLKDQFLTSGVPSSPNLLESLKTDPAGQGNRPRLSAARLSRLAAPTYDSFADSGIIKAEDSKRYRALPAISSRVRRTREDGSLGKLSIIISLDVETAPFSNENVELTAVYMKLSEGLSESIGASQIPVLPLVCRPKDTSVFLFRLTPYEMLSKDTSSTSAKTVLITVHATVLVSSSCQPQIRMCWKTGVDFSTALNSMYGAPAQSMQRQRRPNSLFRTHSNKDFSSVLANKSKPASDWEEAKSLRQATSINDLGISVTIDAPSKVIVGQPFSWYLLILNTSNKTRQLTLKVIPRSNSRVADKDFAMPLSYLTLGPQAAAMAESILSESSLYALCKKTRPGHLQVISLSTDLQIGYVVAMCSRSFHD